MAKELPQFKSEKEEAEFWDGHNSLDYIESDEPVELELDPELAARIAERSRTRRVTLRLRVSHRSRRPRRSQRRRTSPTRP